MFLLFDTSTRHQIDFEAALREKTLERDGHFLCCRNCRHKIVDSQSAIAVNGKSQHRFKNPFGNEYLFRCFSRAQGCTVTGEPTFEHTWFTGCQWQFAICKSCHVHLGWYYSGDSGFYGLIVDNLVPCNETKETQ